MDKKLIKIISEETDWKKGIELGVDLLVKDEACTSELANKICESVQKNGPYFIIMPKVALAHAAPGPYIKKVGLSLIKFNNAVKFSNEDRHQVSLLFTLAAIDGESHMETLMKFSQLFTSDPNLVSTIVNANTVDEIYEILKEL